MAGVPACDGCRIRQWLRDQLLGGRRSGAGAGDVVRIRPRFARAGLVEVAAAPPASDGLTLRRSGRTPARLDLRSSTSGVTKSRSAGRPLPRVVRCATITRIYRAHHNEAPDVRRGRDNRPSASERIAGLLLGDRRPNRSAPQISDRPRCYPTCAGACVCHPRSEGGPLQDLNDARNEALTNEPHLLKLPLPPTNGYSDRYD